MAGKSTLLYASIKSWLFQIVIISILTLLVYASVKQNYRLSANDPQIQLAQEAAAALTNQQNPQTLILKFPILDISQSLAPYLIIFNKDGLPLATSAKLDGHTPIPPLGVFAYVKEHGEDRFSWQPKKGVRSAAVVTKFEGSTSGFVLAGRSLYEVEKRQDQLFKIVCLVWVISLFGTLSLNLGVTWFSIKLNKIK
jgi:hypothetical protein